MPPGESESLELQVSRVGANLSGPGDSIFDTIWDWISGTAGSIWDAVCNFFSGVGNSIKDFFVNLWQGVTAWFSAVWEGTVQWFKSVWNYLSALFTNLWSNIAQFFNWIWNSVAGWFSNIWSNITGAFANLWSNITRWFSDLWSNVSTWFSNLWLNITRSFSNLWTSITSSLANLWTNISGWFSNLWSNIASMFSNLWDKITSGLSNLGTWLLDQITNVVMGAFDWVIGKILDFGPWVGKLFDAIGNWFSEDIPGHSPRWEGIVDRVGGYVSQNITNIANAGSAQIGKQNVYAMSESARVPATQLLNMVLDLNSNVVKSVEKHGAIIPEYGVNVWALLGNVGVTVIASLAAMSMLGELTVLGSKLGLGMVSAMIYDLTNYKAITGALVTELARVAVSAPMRLFYQKQFRTAIPDTRRLQDFYASDDIGIDTLKQFLAYHGLPDFIHDAYADSAYRTPSPYQLAIAAEAGTLDEAVITNELRRAGYHPKVRDMYLDAFKKMAAGNIKSVMVATATGRYKMGITDVEGLKSELKILNVGDDLIPLYTFGAILEYATQYTGDLIDAYTAGVRSGQLSLDEFRDNLVTLGLKSERVASKVLIEKMRIKPTAAKTIVGLPGQIYLTDQGKLQVDTLRIRRVKQAITRDQEVAGLLELGMPNTQALAIADNDDAKLLEKIEVELVTVVPLYKTEAGKVKVDTLRDTRRKEKIDRGQEIAGLAALGVPDYLATAYADNDDIAVMQKIPTGAAPVTPMYETEAGKIKVDTIRRARRKSTITRQDEIDQLTDLEMPGWVVDAIVENDDIRMAEKGESE